MRKEEKRGLVKEVWLEKKKRMSGLKERIRVEGKRRGLEGRVRGEG